MFYEYLPTLSLEPISSLNQESSIYSPFNLALFNVTWFFLSVSLSFGNRFSILNLDS